MRLYLSRNAHARYWSEIDRVAPDLEAVIAEDRHSVSHATPRRRAEIAWLTFDIWSSPEVTEHWFSELLDLDGLVWLHTSGAGLDAPAFGTLLRRGVRLSNSHVTGEAIADFTLRAVLDELQVARAWRHGQVHREWLRHDFTEMSSTTWLIIGVGAIGGAVSRRARAFGAHVIGCRRSPDGTEPCDRMITASDLASNIGGADVVVLAAPASAETRNLVDTAFLAAMKPGSILVNVARGQLVDEDALIAALNAGVLGRAILDTFAVEPLPDQSPLWNHPAVIVTPHNSGAGTGVAGRATAVFLDNLARFRLGGALRGEVTPRSEDHPE